MPATDTDSQTSGVPSPTARDAEAATPLAGPSNWKTMSERLAGLVASHVGLLAARPAGPSSIVELVGQPASSMIGPSARHCRDGGVVFDVGLVTS